MQWLSLVMALALLETVAAYTKLVIAHSQPAWLYPFAIWLGLIMLLSVVMVLSTVAHEFFTPK